MRVIECNLCGEVVQGDDDDELTGALAGHMGSQHADAPVDEQQAREMVDRDAYSATDS